MLGRTPASTAAFSLDAPRAIASQNLTRCSLRPAGGRPRPRLPAEAARSKARFLLPMATPQRRALRQPVESTPSSPGHTPRDPAHSRDTRRRSWSDPSAPPPRALSRRGGRPRPNPPAMAASTTPARDHTTRNSEPSRNPLKPAGWHRLNPTASGETRSGRPARPALATLRIQELAHPQLAVRDRRLPATGPVLRRRRCAGSECVRFRPLRALPVSSDASSRPALPGASAC